MRQVTLTKHRIWGHAPYAGRRFAYEWFCALDHLGRTITGEARIHYLEPDFNDPSW